MIKRIGVGTQRRTLRIIAFRRAQDDCENVGGITSTARGKAEAESNSLEPACSGTITGRGLSSTVRGLSSGRWSTDMASPSPESGVDFAA